MSITLDPTAEKRIRHLEHLGISFFWGASNFMWGALLLVVVAKQVEVFAPSIKGWVMGATVSVGSIPAIVVPLLVGPLSDRCFSRLGRRRPYILFGGLVNLVGLGALYLAGEHGVIPIYVAAYFLMNLGNNIATAAYSGVIPDLVPKRQRGVASGYMAVLSQLGTLLGVFIGGQLAGKNWFGTTYAVLATVIALGVLVSMVGIRETPLAERPPKLHWIEHLKSLWIDPRKHPDFAWVWLTRALVMLGFYSVLPFLLYYLGDVIRVENPAATASWVLGLVLIGATASGYFGGALSDKIGRKRIVYAANGFMAVMCIALALCRSLESVFAVACLFGLGYGAYVSVDWALGTDVLPNPNDAAKDMAVWHISMTLPQSIAPAPAGLLIGAFGVAYSQGPEGPIPHYTYAGFAVLFLVAAIFIGLGAFLLRNVKGST